MTCFNCGSWINVTKGRWNGLVPSVDVIIHELPEQTKLKMECRRVGLLINTVPNVVGWVV